MNGGGRYLRHPDGTLERVEEPTAPHPDGDAPRMADGTIIGADGVPLPAEPAPEPAPAEPAPAPDAAHEGEA
ncbi:MAG: hypothetical protein K2X74_23305 [Acetobacteraceae bacterium]|nr:hypothetical protein [Acetobacteraceae bacterium]